MNPNEHGLRRSWWILLAAVPFGWLAFAAFMYAGRKARYRPWMVAGFAYLVLFWAATVVASIEELPYGWRQAGGIVMLFGWPAAFVHALLIRRPFLDRTRAQQAPASGAQPSDGGSVVEASPTPDRRVKGWKAGWKGGRVRAWAMRIFGALSVLAGVGQLLGGEDRATSLAMLAFGIAILIGAEMTGPRVRRGEVDHGPVPGTPLVGVIFPFSRRMTAAAGIVGLLMGSASIIVAVIPQSFESSWGNETVLRVLAGAGGFFFLWFGWRAIVHREDEAFVALTTQGIHHRMAAGKSFVPWDAIGDIRAKDMRMWAAGVPIREPFVAVDVNDRRRVEISRTGRALMRVNKLFVADLSYTTRALDVDPALLLEAMVFYWRTPEARAELSTSESLRRITAGDLALDESARPTSSTPAPGGLAVADPETQT